MATRDTCLTVEVDVHAIIEAAAVLYAIGDLSAVTARVETDLTLVAEGTASDLLAAAGVPPLEEDGYATDPLMVAASARSHELVAEFAERLAKIGLERAEEASVIRERGHAYPSLVDA